MKKTFYMFCAFLYFAANNCWERSRKKTWLSMVWLISVGTYCGTVHRQKNKHSSSHNSLRYAYSSQTVQINDNGNMSRDFDHGTQSDRWRSTKTIDQKKSFILVQTTLFEFNLPCFVANDERTKQQKIDIEVRLFSLGYNLEKLLPSKWAAEAKLLSALISLVEEALRKKVVHCRKFSRWQRIKYEVSF